MLPEAIDVAIARVIYQHTLDTTESAPVAALVTISEVQQLFEYDRERAMEVTRKAAAIADGMRREMLLELQRMLKPSLN
jgi:hypothetical protein